MQDPHYGSLGIWQNAACRGYAPTNLRGELGEDLRFLSLRAPGLGVERREGPCAQSHGVPETEKCFYDSWDEEALDEILKTQKAVVATQKKEKASKNLYGICVIVDDFAESPQVMASRQGGNALNTLLVRGRHMMISTLILTQRLRLAGSTLRVNAQALVVFRLRNRLELDAIIEELSAVYDKKVLMEMYQLATAEPYSFMFVNLAASKVEDMFWKTFQFRMLPSGAIPNALQE